MGVARRVRCGVWLVVLLAVGTVGVMVPSAGAGTPQKPTPPPKPSVAVFPKSPWYPGEQLSVLVQCHPGATNIEIEAFKVTNTSLVFPGTEIGHYAGSKPQTLWAAGYTVSSSTGPGLAFVGWCMQDGQQQGLADTSYTGTVTPTFDPNSPTVIQPAFYTPVPYDVNLYPFGTASVPFTGTCNSTAVQPGPGSVHLAGGGLYEDISQDLGGGKSNFAGQIPIPVDPSAKGLLPFIIPAQVSCLSTSPPYPYNNSSSQGASYVAFSQPVWLEIYDPSAYLSPWFDVGSLASQLGMVHVLSLAAPLTPRVVVTTTTTTTTTRPKTSTTTRPRTIPTTTSTTRPCPPNGLAC